MCITMPCVDTIAGASSLTCPKRNDESCSFFPKEEERFRNSVMFDLLYVHPRHPLSAQITFYYRLSGIESFPWPIDAVASAGMNGFLWLTKRNGLKKIIPSPVHGLEDITDNNVLNITYLNPAPHAHIPKPPVGVNMPEKILKSFDIKPVPTLWHEDNGRYQRERPQVSGAISGPILGEAAHRLVQNTLNIRPDRTNSRNFYGNHATNRMRPAGPPGYEMGVSEIQNSPNRHAPPHRPGAPGPSGYGRNNYYEHGYYGDPNSYSAQYSPQAPMGSSRYGGPPLPNNIQIHRPIYNSQDRYSYQEQHHDLRSGMSALTVDGGPRGRSTSSRSSNYRQTSKVSSQIPGPLPSPPPKWISKCPVESAEAYYRQQTPVAAGHGRQVKIAHRYQVKNKAGRNGVGSDLQQ